MSTILREPGIETLHDQVVSLLAQRWSKAFQCRVTIKTGLKENRWAGIDQKADLMGRKVNPRGDRILWIAEVETEGSLAESETVVRWKQGAELGVPFYLFVPRGGRETAQKLAAVAEITFNGVYEYGFVNGVLQLL
ncbi:MAG: hypothetical protein AB1555_10305 [Nitrospirota bacterium]